MTGPARLREGSRAAIAKVLLPGGKDAAADLGYQIVRRQYPVSHIGRCRYPRASTLPSG